LSCRSSDLVLSPAFRDDGADAILTSQPPRRGLRLIFRFGSTTLKGY